MSVRVVFAGRYDAEARLHRSEEFCCRGVLAAVMTDFQDTRMHCFRGVFRKNFSFHLFFSIPWQKAASGVKLQAQRVGSSRKWPYQRKGVFKGSCPRSLSEITWCASLGCSATQTPRKPS